MTMQGYADTLPVTLEEMILYGRSVARGCRQAFVVVDMPFMSYQVSPQQALANAGRIMQETGADAVKLEGAGNPGADPGHHRGGHPGVRPHRDDPNLTTPLGASRSRARGGQGLPPCWPTRWPSRLRSLCRGAGVRAPKLAALVTRKLDIITIGIGAGAGCDGQVLVWQDMLGLNGDKVPKFVRCFCAGGPDHDPGISSV